MVKEAGAQSKVLGHASAGSKLVWIAATFWGRPDDRARPHGALPRLPMPYQKEGYAFWQSAEPSKRCPALPRICNCR